jgi:hypothetical protein
VNTSASDARDDDRRGIPMWAIAMSAAVLLGGSAVAITTMRNRGAARATTPAIVASNELQTPPPSTLLVPSTPSARAGQQATALAPMPADTTQSAVTPPIATPTQGPRASAPVTRASNPSRASASPSKAAASTNANPPAPTNATSTNHAGNEAPAPTAQTPAAPAAQTMGTLRVVALPWGEVFVDGTSHGRAPISLRVATGEHSVRITGGVEHTERVVVTAGATRTVTAEGE